MKFRKLLLIPTFFLGASVITFTYTDVLSTVKAMKEVEAATAVENYYSNVNGTGSSLLSSIKSTISSGYNSVGYDGLGAVYAVADLRDDGKFYDLYSNTTQFTSSKACGSYSNVGDCWNKEHSIPKSWWGGSKSNQGCDAYIVVLSDGKINGMRSNMPYGETTVGQIWKYKDDTEVNRIGNSTSSQYVSSSVKVFEPMPSRKGDIARIYFYAMARWNAQTFTSGDGHYVFGTSSDCTNGFKNNYLQMLLKWHTEDPVDDREIAYNNGVQTKQKNRNPFVDHPSWVDLIWGGIYNPNNKNAEDSKNGTAVVKNGKLDAPVIKNLEYLTVESPKTQYTYGDSFVKPQVIAHYDNGDTKDVSSTATFDGYNMIAIGDQTVYARYSESGVSKFTTYTINVKDKDPIPVQNISITIAKDEIYIGDSTQINYTTTPSQIYPGLSDVTYTSSDEDIASVNSFGLVTGISEGEVTITVRAKQKGSQTIEVSNSVTLQVKEREIDPSKLIITRSSISQASGEYNWYQWRSNGVTGNAFIYATTTNYMQFNKSKTSTSTFVPTIYNTSNLSGPINSITMKTVSNTDSWTLYVSNSEITKGAVGNKYSMGSQIVNSTGATWSIPAGIFTYFSLEYTGVGSRASNIESITVNFGGFQKEIDSIEVVNPKTTYNVGDAFVAPKVNALYNDESNKTITPTFSGYNLSQSGTQTVIVTYTEFGKTVRSSYKITVNAKTGNVGGGCGGSVIATSVTLSSIALLGVSLILIKKRRKI